MNTITTPLKPYMGKLAAGSVGATLMVLIWGIIAWRGEDRLDFQYQLERAEIRETAYLTTIENQSSELRALEKGFYFLSSSRRESPLPEWAKGLSGHYQWKNEAFDSWLLIPNGIDVDSVIFRTDMEIWANKDLARSYREGDLQVMKENRVIHSVAYAPEGDQVVAWHVWKYPIRNAQNHTIGVGGVAVQEREIIKSSTTFDQ